MAHKWDSVKAGYTNLWAKAAISPNRHAAAVREAKAIIAAQPVLGTVKNTILYPWYFLGCLQAREAGFRRDGSLDTNAFLGNGQPLDRVTTEVPRGLGPWDNWAAGAYDAIRHELTANPNLHIPPEGISAPFLLYFAEEFNGEGYYLHGINSPYVWAFTSLYSVGKFDSDGHFNPALVDPQCGVAAYLLALCELDAEIAAQLKPPKETPPMTTTSAPGGDIWTSIGNSVIPIALSALAKFFPAIAPFVPIIEELLPALISAVGSVQAATGANPADAASAVVQHLTPGQPNHPALS